MIHMSENTVNTEVHQPFRINFTSEQFECFSKLYQFICTQDSYNNYVYRRVQRMAPVVDARQK